MASVIAPAYIAEIAPAHLRGRLGSLQQLAIVLGIFAALLCDYGFAADAGSAPTNALARPHRLALDVLGRLSPPIALRPGALSIPESPRYLVARGRGAEARASCARMVGDAPTTKLAEIGDTVEREHVPRLGRSAGPRFGLLPIVWVGIALSVFQQFVGINVIFYYSSVSVAVGGLLASTTRSPSPSSPASPTSSPRSSPSPPSTASAASRCCILGSIGMTLTLGTMAFVFGARRSIDAGQPVLPGAPACRARRRQPLRLLLRLVVGPGGLGPAGRDVQQPHPRHGARGGGGGAVDRELRRVGDLPAAAARGSRLRLWSLRGGGRCR